jgi:hypothetical protein
VHACIDRERSSRCTYTETRAYEHTHEQANMHRHIDLCTPIYLLAVEASGDGTAGSGKVKGRAGQPRAIQLFQGLRLRPPTAICRHAHTHTHTHTHGQACTYISALGRGLRAARGKWEQAAVDEPGAYIGHHAWVEP